MCGPRMFFAERIRGITLFSVSGGVYGLFLVILPREIIRYHDTEVGGPDVQPPLPPLDARMMSKEMKKCEYTYPPTNISK